MWFTEDSSTAAVVLGTIQERVGWTWQKGMRHALAKGMRVSYSVEVGIRTLMHSLKRADYFCPRLIAYLHLILLQQHRRLRYRLVGIPPVNSIS
jgi:hypothetical protein